MSFAATEEANVDDSWKIQDEGVSFATTEEVDANNGWKIQERGEEDSRIHPSRRRRPEEELTHKTKKVVAKMGKNGNTLDWFKCYPNKLAVVKHETTGSAAHEKEANLHKRQDKDKVSIPHLVHKPPMEHRSVLDVNRHAPEEGPHWYMLDVEEGIHWYMSADVSRYVSRYAPWEGPHWYIDNDI